MLWRFLSREQRAGFYAKNYPTWGAISLVNVDALWENAGGRMPPPEYLRAVSTGPLAPVVVAATIAAGVLHAGISYQRAAFTAANIDKIADGIVACLHASRLVISRHQLRRIALAAAVAIVALVGSGCATRPVATPDAAVAARPAAQSVLRSLAIDRALEDRILALDPEQITADDVRDTLAKGPAPRIILLHGGIYPVHLVMESAGRFLTGMGYPEDRIRHPGDGRWSHSPYEDSAQIAGLIAWYYEHDGMRPMMIGHSQGGIQAVKVLYELAGRFDDPIRVWNPLTDDAEDRTSIVDPLTGGRTAGRRPDRVLRVHRRRRRRGAAACPTSGAWSERCARSRTPWTSSPASPSGSISSPGPCPATRRRSISAATATRSCAT